MPGQKIAKFFAHRLSPRSRWIFHSDHDLIRGGRQTNIHSEWVREICQWNAKRYHEFAIIADWALPL
jgi:hypothetical protein